MECVHGKADAGVSEQYVGARLGYDPKESEFGKGVSLGVGVGWDISWERIEKVECDNG